MEYTDQLELLKQGAAVWNKWVEDQRHPDRLFSPELGGADLSEADLRGVNLRAAGLNNADLRGADLRGADLSWADLSEADLRGAKLGRANLCMANLHEAHLNAAELSEADLRAADLSEANLAEADLQGACLCAANFSQTIVPSVKWDRTQMRGNYRGIRDKSCYGNALFKRAAADQDFLDALEDHWNGTWRIWLFRAWGLIDYGRSLGLVALYAFAFVLLFGAVYSLWPNLVGQDVWTNDRFTPFYFSIVTYTTLGFGDVTPKGHIVGEIIVSCEVILGYITLGLLLAVLSQKVARLS